METFKFGKCKCRLSFGYYENNTVAISAIQVWNGELWNVFTINYERFYQGLNYAKEMAFPAVVIKNYDINEGCYQMLLDAGVIQQGPYLPGSNGGVQVGVLTEKWAAIAKKELEKILVAEAEEAAKEAKRRKKKRKNRKRN